MGMRFFNWGWVLILSAVLLCGCKHEFEKDTVFIGLSATANTLDPRFATDATGQRLTSLLFSSLVRLGKDLEIEGDAASSWKIKDRVYEFQLKPGLKFSDGQAVTAKDIEFSFQEFAKTSNPFHNALKDITKVEVRYQIAGRTASFIRIELAHPSATFLSDLIPIKILPAHLLFEKSANDQMSFAREPVGSGPFRLISQSAGEIILQARKDHPYQPPRIGRAIFKIIRDDSTRYLKMLKGDLDLVQSDLPANKIAVFESKPDFFKVYKRPGLSMTYLLLNLQDPVLKDIRMRRALADAINRNEIIKYKLEGLASPATSILSPANPFFAAGLQGREFNLPNAKNQIEKLGLAGKEMILKTSNSPVALENGKVLAHQIGLTGLKVKQQSYEWGTFYGDIQKGNFQITLMKWVATIDPDIYRLAFHSREFPPGRNRGRYSNPLLDPLLDQGVLILDKKQRMVQYKKIQEIVMQDLPIIPLWYDLEIAVVSNTVQGYEPSTAGDYTPLLKVTKQELKR
jgi:peptide/nickel transport system substrate-binding protein